MSNMIPKSTADAFRVANNITINNYGIPVTLYSINNSNAIQNLDSYISIEDETFNQYAVNCWIEWSPNTYRLRKLGLFNEGDLPIIAYFRNDIEIFRGSYIKVPIQYMPDDQSDTDRYEIISNCIPSLADIDLTRGYFIAPLRNRTS